MGEGTGDSGSAVKSPEGTEEAKHEGANQVGSDEDSERAPAPQEKMY